MLRTWSSCLTVSLLFISAVVQNTPGQSEELATAPCHSCGAPSQKGKLVECVVMVPTTVVERRMDTRCVEGKDIVKETYTVFKKVPVTKQVMKKECFLVDEVKTQTVEKMKCHVVEVPLDIVYPAQDLHIKGGGKPENKGPVTENCTRNVVAIGKTKKDVTYCVKVPKYRETKCADIHTFELQPVEMTRDVHVCVPRIEKYPIDVTVCKMVPTKVECCSSCARHHK